MPATAVHVDGHPLTPRLTPAHLNNSPRHGRGDDRNPTNDIDTVVYGAVFERIFCVLLLRKSSRALVPKPRAHNLAFGLARPGLGLG